MTNSGSCVDCGTAVVTVRCPACQRRRNDQLQAEHELTVRAMFRAADGRALGRATSNSRSRRPRLASAVTESAAEA